MHSHAHSHGGTGKVLQWSMVVTFLFVLVEIVAGLRAHSLALLSDAGHNFTDAGALLLASIGYLPPGQTRRRDQNVRLSPGGRALRLHQRPDPDRPLRPGSSTKASCDCGIPSRCRKGVMIVVAAAGLVMNGGIMLALRTASKHDINVRSAFIHMLGDALGSVAIIGGAIAIRYTGWVQVDPVLSIVIGLLVVWSAWDITRESLNILLEGLPRGIHLRDVAPSMRTLDGVLDVHDLHIWSLGSSTHALSCHVLIEDVPPSASDCILRRLNEMLADRFHISHTTVQFEHVSCAHFRERLRHPVHTHDAEGHHHPH